MADIAHPLFPSILRGIAHRCPNCGKGRLFGRYLKVEPACAICGHDLAQYRADDGPAYITILIMGHLFVAPLLFIPAVWQHPAWSVPILVTALAALTLLVLPRVKGGWVGLMYALDVSDRDHALHTADLAD